MLALINADPESVHLLQAFDQPTANIKSRARGSGESGATIVTRLRNGDAGSAVQQAVEKCQKEGTAASEANAAELLAMLAEEKAAMEKKKKAKTKKKKKKAVPERLPKQASGDSVVTSEPTEQKIENFEERTYVHVGKSENCPMDSMPTVPSTGDDDGVWMTSGKRRKGRRRRTAKGRGVEAEVSVEEKSKSSAEASQTRSDKGIRNGTSHAQSSVTSSPKKSAAQTLCGGQLEATTSSGLKGAASNTGKHNKGTSGEGVMLMEEVWNHKHTPTHANTAPASNHKLQLRSQDSNIPAPGVERQRAGKQLFMEALWAARGRGSQKWPKHVSRSHYPGFSSGNPLDGTENGRQTDSLEVCPQCGWKILSYRPPKRKLLITDPTTGAAIVARPNDSAMQAPTGSSKMKEWNTADVCEFVNSLLPDSDYNDILREHEVDGSVLSALDTVSSKGFELLGITKFGHIHKIASAVATLYAEQNASDSLESTESTTVATSLLEPPERKVAGTHKTPGLKETTKVSGSNGLMKSGTSMLQGSKLGTPGKAGGVQAGHNEGRLNLPAPPPNEFFCPISFGESTIVIS